MMHNTQRKASSPTHIPTLVEQAMLLKGGMKRPILAGETVLLKNRAILLRLLDLVNEETYVRAGKIAENSGSHKSTVYRQFIKLLEEGEVEAAPRDRSAPVWYKRTKRGTRNLLAERISNPFFNVGKDEKE